MQPLLVTEPRILFGQSRAFIAQPIELASPTGLGFIH
jgi:hypothetical protein